MQRTAPPSRQVSLGEGLAAIPESLLLAHAYGQVLFVVGAGVSCQARLPDYRELVRRVYKRLDAAAYAAMPQEEDGVSSTLPDGRRGPQLTPAQLAEIEQFKDKKYDVVLGMLERRIDSGGHKQSEVRQAIAAEIRDRLTKPAPIHKALMQLADRGQATTIITTNFDLLLEDAASALRRPTQRYSLGEIPRPTYRPDFSGVLHIHGAFHRDHSQAADLVVTDQDFGEFYLRRRIVPDFLYDAARLFSLVLVGYTANDPPMRYLLDAVAADSFRFADLRNRYVFVPVKEDPPIEIETQMATWRGRCVTPIPYPEGTGHEALCRSLQRWAKLSAINGEPRRIEAEIKRIVRKTRDEATEADRDLFAHLIRRGNPSEQQQLAAIASKLKADMGWLNAIHDALAGGAFK